MLHLQTNGYVLTKSASYSCDVLLRGGVPEVKRVACSVLLSFIQYSCIDCNYGERRIDGDVGSQRGPEIPPRNIGVFD